MTTPRTEAGRRMYALVTSEPSVIDWEGVATSVRAIEDEAARKEREPWDALTAEAEAFEAWYGARISVNAWVGVSALHGLYGGWSVEGDALYYEWDESVMTTASGDTPADVIADLIRIAREYRRRADEDHAANTDTGEEAAP